MFGTQIGPMEIVLVLLIALLVFGPKKLPELGKSLGRGMRDFKRGVTGDDEDERRAEDSVAQTAAITAPPASAPVAQSAPAVPVESTAPAATQAADDATVV